MAQAAHSYLLLNIICFIHFALQMHSYTWPHSHFSAEMIQSPPPPPPFLFYVVRKMLQLFFCLFVFCHLSLNSLLNTCFLSSLFLSLQAFWSFMKCTWAKAYRRGGRSSRKAAVVWSADPHWSSTLPAPARLWEWSLITAGEMFTAVTVKLELSVC